MKAARDRRSNEFPESLNFSANRYRGMVETTACGIIEEVQSYGTPGDAPSRDRAYASKASKPDSLRLTLNEWDAIQFCLQARGKN